MICYTNKLLITHLLVFSLNKDKGNLFQKPFFLSLKKINKSGVENHKKRQCSVHILFQNEKTNKYFTATLFFVTLQIVYLQFLSHLEPSRNNQSQPQPARVNESQSLANGDSIIFSWLILDLAKMTVETRILKAFLAAKVTYKRMKTFSKDVMIFKMQWTFFAGIFVRFCRNCFVIPFQSVLSIYFSICIVLIWLHTGTQDHILWFLEH